MTGVSYLPNPAPRSFESTSSVSSTAADRPPWENPRNIDTLSAYQMHLRAFPPSKTRSEVRPEPYTLAGVIP